ncbi:MAG TPA: hypothetical protein VGD89_02085 [Flavipsychrobacter sp.]
MTADVLILVLLALAALVPLIIATFLIARGMKRNKNWMIVTGFLLLILFVVLLLFL